jgi:hypothetical protein
MSYSRQYHEVVHGSKTVSYPASENGGVTTVNISIPVTVNIHVDTIPFDRSVRSAERNINLLTGAVVATESATILAKRKNALKVGDTIVSGFFSYVKSEISQQIAEITQQTEAMLMHIHGLSDSCLAKKEQMLSDYKRITGRYMKLFSDLNKELTNRIHLLDQHAFLFKELTSELDSRVKSGGALSTLMVFNGENTDIQVKLNSTLAKKQAASAMQKITAFLAQQRKVDSAIRHCMQDENEAKTLCLPVCLIETTSGATRYLPVPLSAGQQKMICNYPMTNSWTPLRGENLKQLHLFFNKELNQRVPAGDEQTERIRKMILQLAKIDTIQTLS